MSREIRRVPANWNHPKTDIVDRNWELRYQAMMQIDYNETYSEWEKEVSDWKKAFDIFSSGVEMELSVLNDHCEYETKVVVNTDDNAYDAFVSHYGEPPTPPNPAYYMPTGTWYQLFQTISEGTPISPPFETAEELIVYLEKNGDFWWNEWTREATQYLLDGWYSCSWMISNWKMYSPEEQHKIV